MNISVEEIIGLETVNEDRIHLHYFPEEEIWKAYDKSALNLVEIVPEFAGIMTSELFVGGEVLTCITVNSEMMEL